MAWTAPATWSVSEVVVASKMNAQIRDNLLYLKGQAGDISLDDDLGVGDTTLTNDWTVSNRYLTIATATAPGSSALVVKGARAGSDLVFARLVGVNLSATGTDKTGGEVNFNRDSAADSASISFLTRNAGTIAERLRITKEGFLNAKAATGGGVLFLSAAAVAGTLQTLAVAGTVTAFGLFYVIDKNNTGGAIVPASGNGLLLTQTFAIVNTDTVTVTLTAGGAITVQRTAGTNGTHEIEMLVLYK